MNSVTLNKVNNIYTLTLLREGKFTDVLVREINEAINQVENDQDHVSLIITGEGKNFSQGYDIEFLESCGNNVQAFIEDSLVTFSRLLSLGVPSVAAINGHAFGAGAMLSLACDFRCMREDKGYFCLPEVDLGMDFHPFMSALIKSKMSDRVIREAVLSGKRYSGAEALDRQIVDSSSSLDDLYIQAGNLMTPYVGKNRATYSKLKTNFNSGILCHLKQ